MTDPIKAARRLLRESPFARRRLWRHAVVVARKGEDPHVTSRGDLAQWLKAHACDELARECLARRLGEGEALCFVDVEGSAFEVGFTVLDLRAA